ncbi:unnamed protein product [Acanthosepion pharaonis]|uniref:Uncharacterized protein n=1 Tax=Acanthosepion pharaonis TaxID=158019 RepID=A0A812DC13_ACAPH|nr:unnamed protein product [Sepia pharaonis]
MVTLFWLLSQLTKLSWALCFPPPCLKGYLVCLMVVLSASNPPTPPHILIVLNPSWTLLSHGCLALAAFLSHSCLVLAASPPSRLGYFTPFASRECLVLAASPAFMVVPHCVCPSQIFLYLSLPTPVSATAPTIFLCMLVLSDYLAADAVVAIFALNSFFLLGFLSFAHPPFDLFIFSSLHIIPSSLPFSNAHALTPFFFLHESSNYVFGRFLLLTSSCICFFLSFSLPVAPAFRLPVVILNKTQKLALTSAQQFIFYSNCL